jgi:hypothetical protein
MKTAVLILLLLLGHSFAQSDLPSDFRELLKSGKLSLSLPDGFKVKKDCADTLTLGDVCFKHSSGKIEIRIDIELSDTSRKKYPVLSCYEEGSYDALALDPEKFNATKSAAASFKIAESYDTGFKKCWQIWLNKKKTANVNVFILYGEQVLTEDEIMEYIEIMKFK